MPPAYPHPADRFLCVGRRRAFHLLVASPCLLLAITWSWGWKIELGAVNRAAKERPGIIGLRAETKSTDPEADEGKLMPAYWYPVPDRIEPIKRLPKAEKYMKGAELMQLLEDGWRRTARSNSSDPTNAPTRPTNHDATKAGSEQSVQAAEARGDGADRAADVTTAFAPSWKGMPSASDRCSSIDLAAVAPGMKCGSPLGQPCFDHNRCRPRSAGGPGPSIYVFDGTCSLADSSALPPSTESPMLSHTWREVARDAGVLAESYRDACLFLHVNKLLDAKPCPADGPLWNGGRNHLMVDLTDRTRDKKPVMAASVAMDASSNMRTCYYRSGYDFAVPLRHMVGFGNLTYVAPWHRDFFLTVKGSLYMSGSGHDERMSLVQLHSEADGIVMALNCFEMHDEHLLPENEEFCAALNETASRHDYRELMNTTFGLVPAGRSPATYRLAEVMSAGAIPVFVARDIVRPFPERIDWSSLSFSFTPEEVGPAMLEALRAVPPAELLAMQRKTVETFLDIFGEKPGYNRIARLVIDELVRRVEYHR